MANHRRSFYPKNRNNQKNNNAELQTELDKNGEHLSVKQGEVLSDTPEKQTDGNKKKNFGGNNHKKGRFNKNRTKDQKEEKYVSSENSASNEASEVSEEIAPEIKKAEENADFSEERQKNPINKNYVETENDGENGMENTAEIANGEGENKTVEIVGIKFRGAGKVYFFSPAGVKFTIDDHAIVETVRGMEYGDVSVANRLVDEKEIIPPLKAVIRKATKEDDEKYLANRELEKHAKPIWEEAIKKSGLEMQLVDVEYTFDNAKLIFYFTADGRVDFRDLVKELASIFKTRIELRQIGVRDEAKLIGGLGVCGRPFCCKTFLPDFSQVSIKMAKEQNLSLSSSKISGTCGRLMCCLKFEHEVYEMEYSTFPKVDSIVQTAAGKGVITESNFLTGKIKVRMSDVSGTIKTLTPADVKIVGHVKSSDTDDTALSELEDIEKN